MIVVRNSLSPFEVAVYELLETVKTFSTCKDKQVAAISTKGTDITSVSWNKPNRLCEGDCDAKNKKCAEHAEMGLDIIIGSDVYISLFPCITCQLSMVAKGVKQVFVFGKQHKGLVDGLVITLLPNLAQVLTAFNGRDKQQNVAIGEMAELTVELCNDQRKDTRETNILEEVIDVELQLHCLRHLDTMHLGHEAKTVKYNKLIKRFINDN